MRGQNETSELHGALRAFLQLGVFICGCGAVTAVMLPRDSAEFYVSLCNVAIGLALTGGVIAFVRLTR